MWPLVWIPKAIVCGTQPSPTNIAREALEPLLQLAQACFDQGESIADVLDVPMPD